MHWPMFSPFERNPTCVARCPCIHPLMIASLCSEPAGNKTVPIPVLLFHWDYKSHPSRSNHNEDDQSHANLAPNIGAHYTRDCMHSSIERLFPSKPNQNSYCSYQFTRYFFCCFCGTIVICHTVKNIYSNKAHKRHPHGKNHTNQRLVHFFCCLQRFPNARHYNQPLSRIKK